MKYKNIFIVVLLAIFSVIALWIRLLPESGLVSPDSVTLLGNDPWYVLRQVEQTLAHYPGYGWFDAMTQYPTGNFIHWGPLFVQITSLLPLLGGAVSRYDIMYLSSWAPPLMAVAMVPLMYGIGQRLGDWKTGLLASGFIAVISGQY
ncbi:MAG: STT3 domain-containing protein, partial [bacterium]